MAYTEITIIALRERFRYEPDTGRIVIAKSMRRRGKIGCEAGCIAANGHRYIGFQGKHLLASRLAWALYHGEWPKQEIDHIDGNTLNNRLINLRDVSSSAQKRNRAVWGKTGVKSVHFFQKGYRSALTINRKSIKLGCFHTLEDAEAVVIAKEKELGIYQYRRAS